MIEKAKEEPVSVKQLKVDGNLLIKELVMEPGPRMGKILAVLLEEVIDNPKINTKKYLLERVGELGALSDKELDAFSKKAKERAAEEQKRLDDAIKEKYFVK